MTNRLLGSVWSLIAAAVLLVGGASAWAEARQVAITIDDLPRGGGPVDAAGMRAMTEKLLRPFREQRIPVIGFVNAGRPSDIDPAELRGILDLWLDAGAELGNHTYSHIDINNVSLQEYTADIVRGEAAIRAALTARGKELKFYRHPYLHLGPTPELKQGLQAFLDQRGYRVAPVTIDNADYAFAVAYMKSELRERVRREYVSYMESVVAFFEQRSVKVVGREFPQILLTHVNPLNADLMPELIDMLRRRGYSFITVPRALEDPAYQLPDGYVGPRGVSWIHRWSESKGMAPEREPEPPAWVMEAFESRSRPAAAGR